MKRSRLSRRTSRKLFKRTASRVHKRNMGHASMRGGIRL